jgi:protein-S-isoprenylcysteine O-methyltransferase Ste14
MMRRAAGGFLVLLVALLPAHAHAGETKIYISISVGGVIAVGVGFVAWSIGYRTRVADRADSPDRPGSWTDGPYALSMAQEEMTPALRLYRGTTSERRYETVTPLVSW